MPEHTRSHLIGAVSMLATAISAAPGYVGTFERAATATAVAMGVPEGSALAMAVLFDGITLMPVAVAGGRSLSRSGIRLGRLAEAEEELEAEEHDDAEPGRGVT